MIKPKSGGVFGKGPTDWMLWDPSVKGKLESLHQEGHKIVIITNQGGVESGKVKQSDLEKKFGLI